MVAPASKVYWQAASQVGPASRLPTPLKAFELEGNPAHWASDSTSNKKAVAKRGIRHINDP